MKINLFEKHLNQAFNLRLIINSICFTFLIIMLCNQNTLAFNATSRVTGNWNANATWTLTRTGTISTGGVSSTTVTGVNTLFLTELAVGDTISNNTSNIWRVTAISSNTSLTIASSVNIASTAYVVRRVPGAGDDVTITSGQTITVNGNASCNSITYGGNGGLTFSGAFSLTVAGAIMMDNTTGGGAILTINAGTVTAASLYMSGGGNGTGTTDATITSGTLSISGAVTVIGNAGNTTITLGAGTFNASSLALQDNSSSTGKWGQLTTSTGTVNISGNITFGGGFPAKGLLTFTGAGTLNIGGNLGSGGTFTCSTSTVNFNGSSAQTSAGYVFNTLKANNATGVSLTSAATITTLTIGDLTSNSIFNDSGSVITPGASSVLNLTSGTYNLGSNATSTTWPAWNTRNISSGTTVGYVSGAAQTISTTPSYQNLTFTRSSTKTPASGTLTIGGNWNVNSPAALNTNNNVVNVTGNVTGTGIITQGSGLITVSGDWTNTGAFAASNTGVTMNGAGKQITGSSGLTFTTLTITSPGSITNNNPGTLTVSAALAGTGSFTQGASSTLNITGASTVSSLDASTNSNTVNYNGTSQTIYATNYSSLTLSNSGVKTLQSGTTNVPGTLSLTGTATATLVANISIGGNLSVGSGTTLDLVTFTANRSSSGGTATIAGTLYAGGATNFPSNYTTYTMTGGTVNYNKTDGGQTINANPSYDNLILSNTSGTQTAAGNITASALTTTAGGTLEMTTYDLAVSGALTHAAILLTQSTSSTPLTSGKTWGGTVNYNATSGGQTVVGGTYNEVTLGNTTGTNTAGGNITSTTFNTAAGGTFNLGTSTLAVSGTPASNGAIRTQNTSSTPISAGKTWGGVVIYDGAGQTVSSGTYNNLTLSGSGSKSITGGSTTVNAVLSMEGTATASAAPTYSASSTLQYKGSSGQTTGAEFPSAFSGSGGVIIDNANSVTLNASRTITNVLTFTNGILTTTSSYYIYPASVSRTSGHVYGNLRLPFTGSTLSGSFVIGDASNYTPLDITLGAVGTDGTLTATTAAGDHAEIGTSTIKSDYSVNRNWSVTNNGVGFSGGASVTLNWVNGDVDAGSSTGSFVVGKYDSPDWTYPSVSSPGSNSITATGINSFSDFQVGESNNVGTYEKLLVILPGETVAPNTPNGKAGTATAQTAGTPFTVTVYAVDVDWNVITGAPANEISITTTDANGVLPSNANLSSGMQTFSVTLKTAGAWTITASDVTDNTKANNTSSSITVNPNSFTKLQILVPGETAAPGKATGKTGTPSSQAAGTAFNVTVNAVDAYWNLVSSTHTVGITSSDANAGLPSNAALSGGTQIFSVTFKTAGSWTITSTDITDGSKTANTSPSITTNVGAFAKLQLLVPGETAAPGTASGKTGTHSAQTAGTAFNVTVNAVDANWNIVTAAPADNIAITSSDANAILPSGANLSSGTQTFSVTLITAGASSITATNSTDGTKTANTSPSITVNPGAFVKMQILVPGETAAPGTATGKTGTPSVQTAGTAFNVTVNAVDANWNLVSSTNAAGITSSDANAALPSNAGLVSGTKVFSVTLKTVGSWTVTATNITDGSKTANTSPAISINAGAFTKLQLLAPGETAAPGTATGKTGTPSAQTAGVAFNVTVNAVDANWNLVSSVTDVAGITSSDANATLPSNTALSGNTQTFSVTLKTAGSRTITATDITDGSKTASTSPSITVNPNSFTKLQILVPGETASPGTATGKTGSPSAQTAGTAFNVTVNAVDDYWNPVSSTDNIAITSSDANAALPANAALVAGIKVFSVSLKTVGSWTVTSTDASDGSKTSNTSPSITVNAGAFTKLQLLVPGETAAPGTATGKTGTPSAQTAGTSFNVTVNAVDANWNIVSSSHTVGITSSDVNALLPSNAALSGGTQTFSVTLKTAGTRTVTATNITDGTKTANTSPSITVNPGAFVRLQLLVPGETASAGSATGKSGSPSAQTAGSSFNVTVNAVDANWNIVSSAPADNIAITTTDANATLPSNANLSSGTQTFSVTFKTSGAQNITATNATDGSKTSNSSPSITVNVGAFAKYQILVPGETAAPGTATGKTGTPSAQTAGTSFNVTVNAVDANWNLVTSIGHNTGISSTDPNATLPGNTVLIGGTRAFSLTFKTAGSWTVTATNLVDGTKPAGTSPSITVNPGAFAKLQLLVPGETANPGTATGKTGTPTAQTSAVAFNVTVNAVDANWNIVSSAPADNIAITSSDANANLPSNANLSSGTRAFSITLITSGSRTITATNVTDGTKTANTSPSITVNAGAFVKLQLLVQGETAAPGTATGKTGTPFAQTAGIAFNVTVNAVDANWNLVSSTNTVGITSSDANAALPVNNLLSAGSRNFSITLKTAGSWTITATNITDGSKTANTSPSITTNVNAFSKLQILVPGETAAPGTVTGKTGTPSTQTAGVPYNVIVNAVDANWNLVSTAPAHTISITCTDMNAVMPANANLSSGNQTFSVTCKTAGTNNLTANDVTDGSKTSNTSSGIPVVAAAFAKLQLLVPGETASPGSATGKTGTPSARTAGTAFNVTVNAVDAFWNIVTSAPADNIAISLTDANASAPSNANLSSGTQTFSITFKTVGTYSITATNVTDGSKTASTSPSITVNAGAATKLQLLLPGETAAPGTATGKTGSPTAQTAGTVFTVTVNSVDANWNLASSVHNINISTSDPNDVHPSNAALAGGTRTFNVTMTTVGSWTVTATDVSAGPYTSNTSPSVAINIGAFSKLQILVPGETANAGSATGKTGAPTPQVAGTPFNITVNAVDANWNIVTAAPSHTIAITSSDGNAILPSNANLSSGTQTFSVTLITEGTSTITATDATDGSKTANTSASISVSNGVIAKMQILVPGETAAPGTPTGKTGTPIAQTAGVPFNVIVNAVDANWNSVSSTNTVGLTSTDANAGLPANAALVGGTKTFSVTLKTVGSWTLTASNITDGSKPSSTSPSITTNVGAFSKLQILVPGETAAPGTATGKTGTPTSQASTVPFNVTVNAVDANWNIVTAAPSDAVSITSSDANAVLPSNANLSSGTQTFSVTLVSAGSRTITAANATDGTKTANTSAAITVTPGAFAKLQILVPGETASPGSATGKTGTPSAATAGTAFNVTVNAVDANWNVVSSSNNIGITSSDANATLPSNATLVAGTKTFSVTLRTAGAWTVTATNITDGSKTANTSPSITTNAGAYNKLQILVPGETAAPGTATGKTGTPAVQTAGVAFNVTVNSVDANWNLVTATTSITIVSSDVNAALPASAPLVGGTRSFSVTLKTAGSKTVGTNVAGVTDDTSPAITVNPNSFTKLQLLVPGETASPGSATGKTGSPSAQTSGTAFNVTVNAVDDYWNPVSSAPAHTIAISHTDANATTPSDASLSSGTRLFSVTLITAGTTTVTASDVTDGSKASNSSPSITVNSGAFAKMQLLVPGETAAPGTATGKTGTPSAQTAAIAFTVTVRSVDANWNLVTSGNVVSLSSSDVNAVLPSAATLGSGSRTFSVTLRTVGAWTLTAINNTDGTKTPNTSPSITVNTGAFAKLQILAPGETAVPGSASGKTGTASTQTAGAPFNVTVNAVDAAWNLVSAADIVGITSTDAAATLPSNAALSGGTNTYSLTLKTTGSWTATATDISDGTNTANTSASIPVIATTADHFAINTIGTQTAGSAFFVTITAYDVYNNVAIGFTGTADLTANAGIVYPSTSNAFVSGVLTQSFSLTQSGSGRTITATSGAVTGTSNSFFVNGFVSNAGDYFRSKASGNWNSTSTWEGSHDGVHWSNASLVPTNSASSISMENSYTVTITANIFVRNVVVQPGGQLTINSGVTLDYFEQDGIDVYGTVQIDGTFTNSNSFSIHPGGVVNVPGTLFVRTYMETDGTLNTSGTGNVTVSFPDGAHPHDPFTVSGNINMSGSSTINLSRGNGGNTLNESATGVIILTGTSQILSGGNNIAQVYIGGTLDIGPSAFVKADVGNSSFYIDDGATLKIGSANGITAYPTQSGSIQNFSGTNASRYFSPNAHYEYKGTTAQITGTGLPSTISSLKINNASGVTLTNNLAISDTLDLTNGLLTPGSSTITVYSAGNIINASTSSFVNGKLSRVYAGAGTKLFTVGKGGNYKPITFNYVSLTGTSVVTAEQIESPLTTGSPALPGNTDLYTARYWTISQTGATTFSYKVTLDASGYISNGRMLIFKRDASIDSLATTAPNYTMASALSNSSSLGSPSSFAIGSVCAAPDITVQPSPSSQLICLPGSVSYSVTANGIGNLSYQWKWNGANVGTNSSSYSKTALALSDSGTYSVVVSAGGMCTAYSTASSSAHIDVHAKSTSFQAVTACQHYLWNGTDYTTSGDKTYSTTNAFGCDSTATLRLTIEHPPTTSNAGMDQELCNTTSSLLEGNSILSGNGIWTLISGSGTITTAASSTSFVNGLSTGDNIFQWTISTATCGSSSSQVTLHVNAPPTPADAGPEQTLCNTYTATLAGNTPSVGTGTWALVSGSGTLTTPSSPSSGVTGLANGDNVFSWTITNGTCTSTSYVTLHNSCTNFTVKLFLQAYYLGGGKMSPLLKLIGASTKADEVDTVTVEFRNTANLNTVENSMKGILKTNGTLDVFPTVTPGAYYYLVIKHRNSMELWSADSIQVSSTSEYDFATVLSNAYGSNQVSLGGGNYGIYSGDINQDGAIDEIDGNAVKNTLSSFIVGTYNLRDVTGDARVDMSDLRILRNNIQNTVVLQRP